MFVAILDADPLLRRVERRAMLFCVVAALVALGVTRRTDMAIGVIGGGLLSAASYWAIRGGITVLTDRAAGLTRHVRGPTAAAATGAPATDDGAPPESIGSPTRGAVLLRLAGRYALLGLMAYGMIARLRLHPVGLLIGVSSLAAAASLEAAAFVAGAGRRRSGS